MSKAQLSRTTSSSELDIYRALKALRIETGAFSQLTRRFMAEDFNPKTPNREGVR
ncbi:MAG: hypothetical protein Q9224_004509 [Gallowayella concinna]